MNDFCINLVQIGFCQQSVLESILPVAETNIYIKTNITLSSELYENVKCKHRFANLHFIRSIAALKARNNRISYQNLSETTQNHARSVENNALEHSLIAVPGYIRKKLETFVSSPIRVTSKSVGKRVCNVICPVRD